MFFSRVFKTKLSRSASACFGGNVQKRRSKRHAPAVKPVFYMVFCMIIMKLIMKRLKAVFTGLVIEYKNINFKLGDFVVFVGEKLRILEYPIRELIDN